MTPFPTPGTPDDAVWVFEQEDDEDDAPVNPEFEAATEVFAHETAAESAEVFEEVGETAGEAAAAFTPSIADRVVNVAGPALAAVVTRVAPVVAKGAEALGPVVARAEAVAKPVIDKAEEVAKPFIDKAEEMIAPVMSNAGPYVERAQHAVSDLEMLSRPKLTKLRLRSTRLLIASKTPLLEWLRLRLQSPATWQRRSKSLSLSD